MRFLVHLQSLLTRSAAFGVVASISMFVAAPSAHAAGTAAGTNISNTASASYTDSNGKAVTLASNTVQITVDEILNVKVAAADPGNVVSQAAATNQVMSFTVTNTGNGQQPFVLTANGNIGGGQFNPAVTSVVLDTNGNGVYDPGVDTVYTPGKNDPLIKPDASIKVFVLSTIPGTATNGNLGLASLSAQPTIGAGTPGTVLAGKGNGGVDAVIGASGALSSDKNAYVIQQAQMTFVKSAVIADQFGGSTPVPGATITYSLVANVTGSGALNGLVITDVIPPNTTYQAGSLTLQGAALTDAADSDAGSFTGTGINVALGSVPAGQTRTVTFKVKIN